MKIFDWLLDLFRKKEYYEIDYEQLNNYSISFKEIRDEDLDKLKKIILDFNSAKLIDDDKSKLYEKASIKLKKIDDLLDNVKKTVNEDYRKTYFEAKSENWIFNYFITDSASIYKDVLLICNKLSYPKNSNYNGVMIYPLLAIKKVDGYYYFWDLLQKYDGYI